METQYLISAQIKEWCGPSDEGAIGDPNYGRHKNKGIEHFVVEVDKSYLTRSDRLELVNKFNAKHDRAGLFVRYEAFDVEYYFPPILLTPELDRIEGSER